MESPVGAGQKGRETMSDDDPVLECAKQMATITAAMMDEGLVGGPVADNVLDIIREHRALKRDAAQAQDRLEVERLRTEELERFNRQLTHRIDEADRVIVAMAHRMLSHGAL